MDGGDGEVYSERDKKPLFSILKQRKDSVDIKGVNSALSEEHGVQMLHRPGLDDKRRHLQRDLASRRIVLDDVKNPSEVEAETAILKAIDKTMNETNDEEVVLHLRSSILMDMLQSDGLQREGEEGENRENAGRITIADNLLLDDSFRNNNIGRTGLSFRKRVENTSESGDLENQENATHATQTTNSKKSDEGVVPEIQSPAQQKHADAVTATSKLLQRKSFCKFAAGFFSYLKRNSREFLYFLKKLTLALILPSLASSAFLYYVCGNPKINVVPEDVTGGSYSWWILFFVRLLVTHFLARVAEFILIDFITLHTGIVLSIFGPFVTMMVAQSKGFPVQFIFWALWNFLLLYGTDDFHKHWLYYQNFMGMFSEENTSSSFLSSNFFQQTLSSMIIVSMCTILKRVFIAWKMGRRNYDKYGDRITSLSRKIILIFEVANLKSGYKDRKKDYEFHLAFGKSLVTTKFKKTIDEEEEEEEEDVGDDDETTVYSKTSAWTSLKSALKYHQENSVTEENIILSGILGEWEEPNVDEAHLSEAASVEDLLRFQEIMSFLMIGKKPFSTSFGLADTRLHCAESAQDLYRELEFKDEETGFLKFNDICVHLCKLENGELDINMAKSLVKLFRPERDGSLLMVDFIKSIDEVYKKLQIVKAGMINTRQIDRTIENTIDILFVICMGFVVLLVFGVSPIVMFVPITSILLPFSFMFGSASSDFFRGVLLILLRDPYDVGDRIAVNNVHDSANVDGSTTWFVESVGLYCTTVRLAATNEVATLNNGAISSSRILNAARSPNATVYVRLKFGINVAYKKIETFQEVITKFVQDRPREWAVLNGFRATTIEADLGYVGYILVLSHRKSWQNIGDISSSKAAVSSYCLEVSKLLDMQFEAPPMPINVSAGSTISTHLSEDDPKTQLVDTEKLSKVFSRTVQT